MQPDKTAISAFDKLNEATQCLDKERDFLNALVKTEVAGRVANRIIVLRIVFDVMESSVPEYLRVHATELFEYKPSEVADVLSMIVSEIAREARLCSYLCVKGIFPQAISVLRRGLELVGLYSHIWNEPRKVDCLADSDSEVYLRAFLSPASESLRKSLKKQNIKYRFEQCSAAAVISEMYALLSEYYTHAASFGPIVLNSVTPNPMYSCSYIQRQEPREYEQQYQLAQLLLGLLLTEIVNQVPKDDLLCEEMQGFSAIFALMGPHLLTAGESMSDDLKQSVDALFEALRTLKNA